MVILDTHCDTPLPQPLADVGHETVTRVASGVPLKASPPRYDLCDEAHLPATPARWLCGSRAPSTRGRAPTVLEVSVSLCAPHDEDSVPLALAVVAGELSAITISDTVATALVDYVRFARNVVVDLSNLTAIDHRGAVALNDLDRAASRVGGTLVVHEPPVLVEHVIRFCGVSDRIRICSER